MLCHNVNNISFNVMSDSAQTLSHASDIILYIALYPR